MDKNIRDAQIRLLKALAGAGGTFALAGGTALELYYLKHRFSRDLDFFSPEYRNKEIEALARKLGEALDSPLKLEDELTASNKARMRFYTAKIKGAEAPLKIDFVEDVFSKKPVVAKFDGVPVYDVKNIYFQKIITLTGTSPVKDEIVREIPAGRKEPRDAVDIYYLSKKVEPLHKFMKTLDRRYQRGMVQWHRSYSRQDLKLGVFDLELYDPDFDSAELISHLDREIKQFMEKELK